MQTHQIDLMQEILQEFSLIGLLDFNTIDHSDSFKTELIK
jgi:hypothetical protein